MSLAQPGLRATTRRQPRSLPAPSKDLPVPGRAGARVLLADSDAATREFMSRLLAEHYEVMAFADERAAFTAVQEQSPDLILSDIRMPGLLRKLRENEKTRGIPLILMSAHAGDGTAVEDADPGAADYLGKPFSGRELIARVRMHVELAQARREWAFELEQSTKELEAFRYSVSHDLRAPLRAIDGFSKALLDEYAATLDEQACCYLRRVRTAAQKMSTLINDLLDLSRVSQGSLRKECIDLTALARTVVTDLDRQDPARTVTAEIEEGLSATADKRLVTIVLQNLLANAWKFTAQQAKAHICFGSVPRGKEQVYYVRDNGVGFDMAYAAKLFTPFQRLHRESEFAGDGIGLAIAQRVISRHGGRIWADAAIQAGATFYFTLGDPR